MTMKKQQPDIVENLLKGLDGGVSNEALKLALAAKKKQDDERDARLALAVLQVGAKHLNTCVEHLRNIRKMEVKAREQVLAVDALVKNFTQGRLTVEAFQKELAEARDWSSCSIEQEVAYHRDSISLG